jgi:hypothetical protein
MTRKTPSWLHSRREFYEERFSFLVREFGYRRRLRRFRWGGFQLGHLGPGAGVLVEWYPRDGVMVWLLPLKPGETPASWGSPGGPRGLELAWSSLSRADGRKLRFSGQKMLRGDYSQVAAMKDLIRVRTERPRLSPDPRA